MSYAPSKLLALRDYLMPKTGLSPVSLGIVGDAAHQRRASYHNGQDAVDRYGRTAANDYTIRTPRDREPHLTNAASAIDIGRFTTAKGGAVKLRHMSRWLVARARANTAGTRDMREIIYSPDGVTVLRWDRERGVSSLPRSGEADSSHLTHTHISWYRDSQLRDKVGIFKVYFEPSILTPVYKVRIDGRTQTYTRLGAELGEISGLTVQVGNRIMVNGRWLYPIVASGTGGATKYKGRWISPTGETTFTRLEGV